MNPDTTMKFSLSRTFDAPRALVFKAFSESDRLTQWWGPKGFVMKSAKHDFRPGGAFHYCMASPTGVEMWGIFKYRSITAPEEIVFTNGFSDAAGGLTRHPLAPTWPLEILNTLTFAEKDGKTVISMLGDPLNATDIERQTFVAGFPSMQAGFSATLDQLADYLKSAVKG
jgi:uncharacterized protein YndB with AHSA1/START domain